MPRPPQRLAAAIGMACALGMVPAVVNLRGHAAAAQTPGAALRKVTTYTGILDRYRNGETDAAVAALIAGGGKLLDDGESARRGAADELLFKARAAALLHSDATAALWFTDRAFALRHFGVATDWARLAAKLGDEPFERRWTLAAGLLLVELGSREGRVESALEHFDLACAHFGQDVPLLLAAAWLEERTAVAPLTLSTARLETYEEARQAQQKRTYLERARGRLERARRADPANAEVALRWGHVQVALGDAHDARRRLDELLHATPPLDAESAYLARLFLGQALVALDQPDAAAASYEAAIALLPRAQSARLGRLAVPAVAAPAPDADAVGWLRDDGDADAADPWIGYLVGRLAEGPRLRAALRREAQR